MNHAINEKPLSGVTGVILAGGRSSRMGSNKALLPYRGGRFIEAIHRQLDELFPEVLLVTNNPEQYEFLPCRKVADLYPGMGALAGLHAGLHHAANGHVFAVACDMPYLSSALIRRLARLKGEAEVVIPEGENGAEPLHALYGKGCLPFMEESLAADRRRIASFFHRVRVKRFTQGQVAAIDPGFDSFRNINTPDEYYGLRKGEIKNGVQPDALRFHDLKLAACTTQGITNVKHDPNGSPIRVHRGLAPPSQRSTTTVAHKALTRHAPCQAHTAGQ